MIAAPSPPPGQVCCSSCSTPLPGPWVEGEDNPMVCPRCRHELIICVFPPLHHSPATEVSAGKHAMEGEATCFFHPEKRAERPCDRCGRFLCALCDLPFGSRHLCPLCLKAGNDEKALPELVSRRVSWGRLSLLLGCLPLTVILWPFVFGTAPAAIFVAIFGWNRPASLVHGRRRIAAVCGLLLGLAEIVGIISVFYFTAKGAPQHGR